MTATEPRQVPLAEAKRYETGTMLTIRMRGHSRTNGEEYFAPAIVLDQHDGTEGPMEVLVFDPTAGTHYNHAYPSREVGVRGDGNERYMYEVRSNIGTVLFSPELFAQALLDLAGLKREVQRLQVAANQTGGQKLPTTVVK